MCKSILRIARANSSYSVSYTHLVIAEVDLVVAGGSSRAIAAAVAAAKTGSRVYLVGYMPYLGEDICGSHLYEREAGEKLQTALARKLFPGKNFPTPLHIKKTLEDELIDNNVQFLYSSYVTDVYKRQTKHCG